MTKWEYMTWDPRFETRGSPPYRSLEDLGRDGWEAVCAWTGIHGRPPSSSIDSYTKVLFKRPIE